jgi:hypothetical protein
VGFSWLSFDHPQARVSKKNTAITIMTDLFLTTISESSLCVWEFICKGWVNYPFIKKSGLRKMQLSSLIL